MRTTFGNQLKQVWLIARQGKSLRYPMCGGNSGCPRESSLDEFSSSAASGNSRLSSSNLNLIMRSYCRSPDETFYPDCGIPQLRPNGARVRPEGTAKLSKDDIEL